MMTGQFARTKKPNRSSAVMQQRTEARDSLDDFPTPPWATRALCAHLIGQGVPLHLQSVHEPACNRGHMALPLSEYFDRLRATDVHDYGWARQDAVEDFLIDWDCDSDDRPDWIVTNPPFVLAEQFLHAALARARSGVAMFVRLAFVEGAGRYRALFGAGLAPEAILCFAERVVLWKGVMLDPDVPVWEAKTERMKKPSSAAAYCWCIWRKRASTGTEFNWVAPTRRALTRPGDYPAVPAHLCRPAGELL